MRHLLLLSSVTLVGCVVERHEYVRYQGSTLPPRQRQDVHVFRGGIPDQPYRELGTVEVTCPGEREDIPFEPCSYEQLLWIATEGAARAGADAIFNVQWSDSRPSQYGVLDPLRRWILRMTATAAQFTPPGRPAPTPQPPVRAPEKSGCPALRVGRW